MEWPTRIVEIITVSPSSQLLCDVKVLWRDESRWLGFLPNGAFEQAASEGRVVAAVDQGRLVGYVLYRLSQRRVMITHLTVSSMDRSQGVARQLIEHLSHGHPMSSGIGLRCRRDYPANKFWPKIGFVALHDREGRSFEGLPLTFWWLDHGHPGLFSQTATVARESVTLAAIDANVFFDLIGAHRTQGEESQSLRDDWIQDEVTLCVTEEIFNDINRDPDEQRRKKQREAVSAFHSDTPPPGVVEAKRRLLRNLFPATLSDQTSSDLKHICRAAAAEIPYFITRDEALLRLGASISEAAGVTVLAPTEFINRIDRLRREDSYRPVRLAGGVIKFGLAVSEEVSELARLFGGSNPGAFRKHLRDLLRRPTEFSCQVARGQSGEILAFVIQSTDKNSSICKVTGFEIRAGAVAETIARYLLHRLILDVGRRGQKLLCLDNNVQDPVVRRAALEEYGFVPAAGETALVKYCPRIIGTTAEIIVSIEDLMSEGPGYFGAFKGAAEALHQPAAVNTPASAASLEKTFWPAKFTDANLPSFVIPIQARWAEQLFDEDLAGQMLLSVNKRQLMAREGVYYRDSRQAGLTAPARLLWYVSQDADYSGCGAIRACSVLDEIVVGPATAVYGQFRRLGVYRWNDIAEMTDGDENTVIMALRFMNTEPFVHPVEHGQLAAHGIRGTVQGPRKVGVETFSGIYRAGMSL